MTAEFAIEPRETATGRVEPSAVIFTWRRNDAALTISFKVNDQTVFASAPTAIRLTPS